MAAQAMRAAAASCLLCRCSAWALQHDLQADLQGHVVLHTLPNHQHTPTSCSHAFWGCVCVCVFGDCRHAALSVFAAHCFCSHIVLLIASMLQLF